jgi:predicted dehydrogenase
VLARAQWHKKNSWRRTFRDATREQELNWRLVNKTSTGLMGESCIHLLDAAMWFMGARPTAVTGFSSLLLWDDGRDVPDTVQGVFEFPDRSRLFCDATLCNSFEGQYEVYYGSDSAILVRDSKAWQFKEVDSPLLEWEVYARKETFGAETGISLVADASKQKVKTTESVTVSPYQDTPLSYALQAFTDNAGDLSASVDDFVSNFGADDAQALKDHVATLKRQPAAGWKEGLEATVLAIKANEAAVTRQKIDLKKEFFEL